MNPTTEAGIAVRPPSIHALSTGWKTFFLLAIAVLFGLAGFVAGCGIAGYDGMDIVARVVCTLFGGAAFVAAPILTRAVLRYRVETFEDRIRIQGHRGTRELLLADLRGYRVEQRKNEQVIVLVPADPSAKKTAIGSTLADGKRLEAWIRSRLTDLDAEDYQRELGHILADSSLGATEVDRADALAKAARTVQVLTWIASGAAAWAFLHPQPYDIVAWTLLTLPVLALILARLSHGLIQFASSRRTTARPAIAMPFMVPSFVAMLRAIIDWNLVDWAPVWIPAAVLGLPLFVLVFVLFEDVRSRFKLVPLAMAVCLAYGLGATILLNGILDDGEPEVFTAKVLDKRVSSGKHTSYNARLSSWGPRTRPEEVELPEETFESISVGEEVIVAMQPGWLKIPWLFVALIEAP